MAGMNGTAAAGQNHLMKETATVQGIGGILIMAIHGRPGAGITVMEIMTMVIIMTVIKDRCYPKSSLL